MRAGALLLGLLLAGPALAGEGWVEGERADALIEHLKGLEGEWRAVGEDGQPTDEVVLIYRVVAGGHAIMSTEFPGTVHEMITVYHREGDGVEMTHYCALGNRPNMRARSFEHGTAVFECRDGAALDRSRAKHMHHGTMRRVGSNEMKSEWILHDGGEAVWTAAFHVVRAAGS